MPFNPKYQFVNKDGQSILKTENEADWGKWYLENILFQKYQ